MDFISMFLSVLFAFIVKNFYDIFIQSHIKSLLKKYKITIIKNKHKILNDK